MLFTFILVFLNLVIGNERTGLIEMNTGTGRIERSDFTDVRETSSVNIEYFSQTRR